MKKAIVLIIMVMMIPLLNSCGTIYGAAVDERNVKTIASDNEIKLAILNRFSKDELVGIMDFSVSSYQGHVYLIGEYKTEAQRDRAVEIARNQPGVKGMTTYLIPEDPRSACGPAKNLELTAKVKAKLVGDKEIWSTNIDVKTMQCITVLWGLVGTQTEVEKAVFHAGSVEGVDRVRSYLKVKK